MTGLIGSMQRNLMSSLTPSECQVLEGSGREKNTKCEGNSFSFWYSPRLPPSCFLPSITGPTHFLSKTFINFYNLLYTFSQTLFYLHSFPQTFCNIYQPFVSFYTPSFTYLALSLAHFPTECEVLTIPGILNFLFREDTEQNLKHRQSSIRTVHR